MIVGLLWLLGCQLVGEVMVRVFDVPVPGPVVGMAVLLLVLVLRRPDESHPVVATSTTLLDHLQLLFVPAGVGVVAFAATLQAEALPLAAAIVGSWLIGLAVVGWSISLLRRRA